MGETVEINLNLTTVGTELLKTIAKINEGLTEQFATISQNLRQNGKAIVTDTSSLLKDLTQAFKEGNWKEVFTLYDNGEEALKKMKAFIVQIQENISAYTGLLPEKILSKEVLSEVKKRITTFEDYYDALKKAFNEGDWEESARRLLPEEIFSNVLQIKTGVEKARDWVNGVKQAFKEGGLEAALKEALPEDLFNKVFGGKEIYKKAKDYINEIKQAFMDGGIKEVLHKIFSQDFQDNLAQTFTQLQGWLQQLPTVFSTVWQNISSGLGDLVTGITGNLQVVWGFLTSLPSLFTQAFTGLWSTLGNVFNSLIKMMSNAWQFMVNTVKNIGSWFSGLSGKAEGGNVTANKPYIVGEKGPEIFIPGNTGFIIPNNQLSGNEVSFNAAPQVTVNVINNTGQQVTSRQETHHDGQQYVVSVWLDALSRNVGGLRDVVMAGR